MTSRQILVIAIRLEFMFCVHSLVVLSSLVIFEYMYLFIIVYH